jgi:hypothetical protein
MRDKLTYFKRQNRGGMMKSLKLIPFLIITSLLLTTSANSQFLGQLETAPTLLRGEYSMGGYAGVYDDAFAIWGGFRAGVTNYMDFGLRLGFLNYDYDHWEDESGIVLGADVKYRILETEIGDPLDLSLGGGMEFSSVENYNRMALGGNAILSKDFCFGNGRVISPYGRLNLRMERKSWEAPGSEKEHSDTDLEMGINLGVSLELTSNTFLVGELQLDEFDGIIIGANFYID